MPKKKLIKKHSVKANLHVVELTRAGSSLDLAVYADKEKIGTMINKEALSSQQTANSKQQTVDSRQQTGDSRQQTADSKQQTVMSDE